MLCAFTIKQVVKRLKQLLCFETNENKRLHVTIPRPVAGRRTTGGVHK